MTKAVNEVYIPHFNRRLQMQQQLRVLKIDENTFEVLESDPFDHRYFPGVIIETKINEEGFHETIRFTRPEAKLETYLLVKDQDTQRLHALIEELGRYGVRTQRDMGGILSFLVPNDLSISIFELMEKHEVSASRFN